MKTQERQERLARVQEIALRKGYAVATPPRGKYRYTLRSNRRGRATYLSGATLEVVERWLGTDEPTLYPPNRHRGDEMTNHKNLLQLLTEMGECVYCHTRGGGCDCGQVDLDDLLRPMTGTSTDDWQETR